VDPDNVRPVEFNALLEAERVAEATKQAIKRKIAQAASVDFTSKASDTTWWPRGCGELCLHMPLLQCRNFTGVCNNKMALCNHTSFSF